MRHRAMNSKIDFKRRYKSLFAPKGVPQIADVPRFQYLTISGKGAPEGEAFQNAVNALYSTAYSLKFLLKKAAGSTSWSHRWRRCGGLRNHAHSKRIVATTGNGP